MKDGSHTQTLKYSINDYAARMQNSKNEAMKTLAKSLYYYGESAKALKEYQKTSDIIKEPTYTETGIAKINGKEVVLPILNADNYNYSEIAKDGSKYDVLEGKEGIATFTHKTYSNIKIKKEITADTLTCEWTDYNNVDINWRIASKYENKMQGTYQDGTYILTINDTVEVPNISKLNDKALPSVKINGKGTLKVTTLDSIFKNLVVDEANCVVNNNLSSENINVINKGTLNVNGTVSVTNLNLDNESTLIVTGTTDDAISVKNEGNLYLFGTANLKAAKGKTGICFASAKSALHLSNTSRVTISGENVAATIGYFNTNENVKVYYPKNAILENNKITSSEGNILLSYGVIWRIVFEAVE